MTAYQAKYRHGHLRWYVQRIADMSIVKSGFLFQSDAASLANLLNTEIEFFHKMFTDCINEGAKP